MVNDGIAYSFGVIMEPMRADLGVGVGSISLVGGVLAGVTMLTGPLAAAFLNRSLLDFLFTKAKSSFPGLEAEQLALLVH